MIKKPTRKTHRDFDDVRLNITPVMNLFVVLIPFLLISAAFLQISVIDTALPRLAISTVEDVKDKLIVTLKIQSKGFLVDRVGNESDPVKAKLWEGNGKLARFIPKTSEGDYRFEQLNLHMNQIKKHYPNADSVLIFPNEFTDYETVIQSMDATREFYIVDTTDPNAKAEKILLFPRAILGHQAEEDSGKK